MESVKLQAGPRLATIWHHFENKGQPRLFEKFVEDAVMDGWVRAKSSMKQLANVVPIPDDLPF